MTKRNILAPLLVLLLLLTMVQPALAADTAVTMQLSATEGTVSVSNASGRSLTARDNMRLYSGYQVETAADSYAWINLDDTKLIKLDANSKVEIRKSGKKLEVLLESGSMYGDVSKPLESDETLNVRTSTTIVGIRGTKFSVSLVRLPGQDVETVLWITQVQVYEGTLAATVQRETLETTIITAGTQLAVRPGGQEAEPFEKSEFSSGQIAGYVLVELVKEPETLKDLDMEVPVQAARERLEQDQAQAAREQAEADAARTGLETAAEPSDVWSGADEPAPPDTGTAYPDPPPGPVTATRTMPLAAADLQSALNGADVVNIRYNPDDPSANMLSVPAGTSLNVAAGKTLNLETGVGMTVESGGGLSVAGTVNADDVTSSGDITVSSSNTLYVKGDLTSTGTLTVTATGKLVVDGAFTHGNVATLSLTDGARVLSGQGFGGVSLPTDWTLSDTKAAYNGAEYFCLVYAPPRTVTFDPNGGTLTGDTTAATVGGKLGTLPTPTRTANTGADAAYSFDGWYDAAEGGTQVTTSTVFTRDTTVYAHWTVTSGWDWAMDGTELRIFGTGAMTDFTSTAAPWGTDVTDVTIDSGITSVGQNAFTNCDNLANVALPQSITSIGSYAFQGCGKLTGVTFSGTPTFTNTGLGMYVFLNCTELTSFTVPNGVTEVQGGTFQGCTSLESVTIPAGVTAIDASAFDDCTALTQITFGGTRAQWDAFAYKAPAGVTVACTGGNDGSYAVTFNPNGGTLAGDSTAATVGGKLGTLPAPTRTANTGAAYTFAGWYTAAEGGEQVTTDTVFTENATIYAHWTGWNWELTGTALRIFGTGEMGNFTESDPAPWGTGVTGVTIEDGITTIGDFAFYACKNLSNIRIPDSVTSIGNSAFNQTGLTSVNIPAKVTGIGRYAFSHCSALTSVTFATGSQLESIGGSAFSHCTALTGLTLPDRVTSIGSSAFYWCTALERINIPDGVTSIDQNTFYRCEKLTDIVIPASVTGIGESAFADCYKLTGVTIPEKVTGIGNGAFSNCHALTSITIPDNVTSIENNTFQGCTSLAAINIPEKVTSIADHAFYGCSNLNSVTFGENSLLNSIGTAAFFSCTSLAAINIPAGVTSIGSNAFQTCTSLATINIPDGAVSIGNNAFEGCTNLTTVTIPAGVTSIASYAFSDCMSLTSITYQGTRVQWSGVTKGDDAIPAGVTVHCSDGDFGIYTVTLDLQGGTFVELPEGVTENEDGTWSVETDSDGKLLITIPNPVRDGYAFDGWYIEAAGEESPPQKITPNEYQFIEDTAVDAVWTESILDLKLSDYADQAAALTDIQTALDGSTYTRVNVTPSTSTLSIQSDLTVPAGKVLNLDCPLTLGSDDGSTQGTLTVNGTLSLYEAGTICSNSKIVIAGTGTIKDYGKVTVNSGGAVENAGTFNTGSGGKDFLIIEAGGTFTNTGKLYLDYYNAFTNSGTFTNATGGVLDGGPGSGTNEGTFINSGTINSSVDITNASGGRFTNNGSLESSSLTNEAGGTITNHGTLTNKTGGTLDNSGSFTNATDGLLDNSGTITNNGTLTNDGTYFGSPITGGTIDGENASQVTGGNHKPGEETP